MATVTDFAARGRVKGVEGSKVIFAAANTNYEVFAESATGGYVGPVGAPIEAIIRVKARKVYTVPSGGNFVTPIFGPPKIIQGRVRHIDGNTIIVQAGLPIVVELPGEDSAVDLESGGIHVGAMVNVVALPGPKFEFVGALTGK
jgi:hypothetical protein